MLAAIDVQAFLGTLPYMGKGMLGIFTVTLVIILCISLLNNLTKDMDKKLQAKREAKAAKKAAKAQGAK